MMVIMTPPSGLGPNSPVPCVSFYPHFCCKLTGILHKKQFSLAKCVIPSIKNPSSLQKPGFTQGGDALMTLQIAPSLLIESRRTPRPPPGLLTYEQCRSISCSPLLIHTRTDTDQNEGPCISAPPWSSVDGSKCLQTIGSCSGYQRTTFQILVNQFQPRKIATVHQLCSILVFFPHSSLEVLTTQPLSLSI